MSQKEFERYQNAWKYHETLNPPPELNMQQPPPKAPKPREISPKTPPEIAPKTQKPEVPPKKEPSKLTEESPPQRLVPEGYILVRDPTE